MASENGKAAVRGGLKKKNKREPLKAKQSKLEITAEVNKARGGVALACGRRKHRRGSAN